MYKLKVVIARMLAAVMLIAPITVSPSVAAAASGPHYFAAARPAVPPVEV